MLKIKGLILKNELVFQRFENSIKFISTSLMIISGVCLVLMMCHVGLDIGMKLAFNKPLIGTLETVSYYYMVSVVFLPLAYVELKNEHVSVDLFFNLFSEKLQIGVYVFGGIVGILYLGVFCYQTTIDAMKALTEYETIMSNVLFYVWPSRWALPFGFGAFALAVLLNIMKVIKAGSFKKFEEYSKEQE